MKKSCCLILVLISLSLLLGGCERKDLAKDMIAFDKAYIPALTLTGEKEVGPAKQALKILNEEWAAFVAKHGKEAEGNLELKRVLGQVGQLIQSANRIMNTTGDLPQAHQALESVRRAFFNFRKKSRIGYYLDNFNELQDTLGDIVWIERWRTPETLTDDEVKEIAETLKTAIGLCDRIQQEEFDTELFGFSAEKSARLRVEMGLESDALKSLQQAIERKDKAQIFRTVSPLRPHSNAAYILFGDFERVKKAD